MAGITLLTVVLGLALLGLLAHRFGHDSRDGLDVPTQGALWGRTPDRPPGRPADGGRAVAPNRAAGQWSAPAAHGAPLGRPMAAAVVAQGEP